MLIKNLNEELDKYLELPDKLYHATYGAFINSIKKNGLLLGKNKNWADSKKCIYLATDPDVAGDFCEVALDEMDEDTAEKLEEGGIYIIEIDSTKLDKSYLEIDDNNLSNFDEEITTYQYLKNIPINYFLNIFEY